MPIEEKLAPMNRDSEEAVCGSLLIDGDMISEIYDKLSVNDFFCGDCKNVFEACIDLYDRGSSIDQITVATELSNNNKLVESGGTSFLSYLVSITPTSLHIAEFAEDVRKASLKRKVISFGFKASKMGYDEPDVEKIIASIGRDYFDIQGTMSRSNLFTPEEWAKEQHKYYVDINNEERKPSLSTGIQSVDYFTGGLFPSEHWIIAAAAGSGKTTFGTQIMQSMCNKFTKRKGLIVSLEQKKTDIGDRIIAGNLGWELREVRSKQSNEDRYGELTLHTADIAELNLFYYGVSQGQRSKITAADIYAVASNMKMRHGLDVILIDYIQRVYAKGDEYERLSNISGDITFMGQSLGVGVISLCQLNRAVSQRDVKSKIPLMSDLRGSGNLEQDADVILGLTNYSKYVNQEIETGINKDGTAKLEVILKDDNRAEVNFLKQRQSDEASPKIYMRFDKFHRKYSEDEKGW